MVWVTLEKWIYWLFHPLSLEAIRETLSDEEFVKLDKYGLQRLKGIFPNECLDSMDKFNNTQLPPKEAFSSKIKQCDNTDEEYD